MYIKTQQYLYTRHISPPLSPPSPPATVYVQLFWLPQKHYLSDYYINPAFYVINSIHIICILKRNSIYILEY